MKSILKLCIATISLLIAGNLRAQVSIHGSSSFEMKSTDVYDTTFIPLTIDSTISFKHIVLNSSRPFSVRRGNLQRNLYKESVNITPDTVQDGFIVVSNVAKINEPGTYDIIVKYSTKKKKNNSLSFSLVRPLAALDTVTSIYIIDDGWDRRCDPLLIKETGRKSGIQNLKLNSPYIRGVNSDRLITFRDSSYHVKAGTILQIPYKLDEDLFDDLPYGKTYGKLQVLAPEVIAPLQIPFKIIKTRPLWWIFIAVFSGLVLGLFVRYYLAQKKALQLANYKIFGLKQKLEDDLKKVSDSGFTVEINELKKELEDIYIKAAERMGFLPFGAMKHFDTEIDALTTRYNAFKQDFIEKMEKLKEEYSKFAKILNPIGRPVSLAMYLADAQSSLAEAKMKLDLQNRTGTEKAIDDCKRKIANAIMVFHNYTTSAIKALTDPTNHPKIPDGLGQYATEVDTKLKNIKSPVPSSADELSSQLEILERIQHLIETVGELIESVEGKALIKLRPDAIKSEPFKKAYDQWLEMIRQIINNPDRRNSAQGYLDDKVIRQLIDVWKALPQTSTLKASVPGNPITFVATNKFFLAPIFKEPEFNSVTGEEGQALAESSWQWFSIFQFVGLLIVLCALAYKLYSPGFVGTMNELITIFLSSFMIDVSLDNIAQAFKKV